ncbi:hypothetical protein PAERUG_E16_London_17_VIM_2_04_14_02402 [Pseudomonas aeruginosa]|nr:hypothetical protein PAERUG_E16_London_17_VIM_2_04_14_02402 [Pseudomonas aeruginosa]
MLAVGQQVMHQQLLQERIEERRQLGEEHPEVFQHFLSRQRLAGSFRTHAATVDEIQAAGVAQQVVQVQVVLPEALCMQLANGCQGFAEHRLLGIAQRRLGLHRTPGVTEALRRVEVVEQQPAALALLQPVGQQRRGGQPLGREQTRPFQFALEMPCGLAAHQQLGQHLAPTPFAGTDVALPGQHPQQTVQAQFGSASAIRQGHPQWQLRVAPGGLQFGQSHRRDSLRRRRWSRRRYHCSTSAESRGSST